MENENIIKLKKEVEARFAKFQIYLDGDFVNLHEYPASDPEFRKRVNQLYWLVKELNRETDNLYYETY